MRERIFITGCGLVNHAGKDLESTWTSLQDISRKAKISYCRDMPVGRLDQLVEPLIDELQSEKHLRSFDRATLLGILAARQAYIHAGSPTTDGTAVIVGSSRGATNNLERDYSRFFNGQRLSSKSSPTTTAAVFATSIAQDLSCNGLSLSVSGACATGLQAIGLAYSLIRSNQCKSALAGATESCINEFTIAQLQAVGILTEDTIYPYLCLPMHPRRKGMVLSEGAAILYIETSPTSRPLAMIEGFGAYTENLSMTGISDDGFGLASAIEEALKDAEMEAKDIDLIVGHGAGTPKGDASELSAYQRIFKETPVRLTFHKWLTGHMLAASPAASVGLALKHLETNQVPQPAYFKDLHLLPTEAIKDRAIEHILVTAMGFGGGACALVLSKYKEI
jgi:3-oxoacyl-[acyl-carrier-protein] synthase II